MDGRSMRERRAEAGARVSMDGSSIIARSAGGRAYKYAIMVGTGLGARSKECGRKGICEHGRHKSQYKECGGKGICEHGREKHYCKECRGKGICGPRDAVMGG
jgi:hypothetical protein